MRKPGFFIVGAPKCGTTALNTYLAQHPDVFMGPKETDFFSPDVRLKPYPKDQYYRAFDDAGQKTHIGEASVFYLYSDQAARAIHDSLPEAKIIVMLRNPVDLLYSLHSQLLFTSGREDIHSFEAAPAAEPHRMRGKMLPPGLAVPPKLLFYSQIAALHVQLGRYLDLFSRRSIHIIVYDDFKRNTALAFDQVCAFLGIQRFTEIDFQIVNANKRIRSRRLATLLSSPPSQLVQLARKLLPRHRRKELVDLAWRLNIDLRQRSPLSPEFRERLTRDLEPVVIGIEKLLGRSLESWKARAVASPTVLVEGRARYARP